MINPTATLLAVAGLPAFPAEVATLEEAYEELAPAIGALYAIPECRYESPGLIFTATPVFADWCPPVAPGVDA